MKHKIKRFICFLMIAVFTMSLINIQNVTANNYQPNSTVIPCKNSKPLIKITKRKQNSIYKRLNIFAAPGVTYTVTQSFATTISNSASINLIPEILDLGYEKSVYAGNELSWSKTNTTNDYMELVIVKIYDVLNATHFSSYKNGYCTVSSNKNYNIVKSATFDLK